MRPVICRFCKKDIRDNSNNPQKRQFNDGAWASDFKVLRWHIQEQHKEEWAALKRKIYPHLLSERRAA